MKKSTLIRVAGLLAVLLLMLGLFTGCMGGTQVQLNKVRVNANGETEPIPETTAPAESGETAEPSESGEATEPSESGETAAPSESGEPAETAPAESTEPTQPDDGSYEASVLPTGDHLSNEVKFGVFDYVKWLFSYVLSWLCSITGNFGLALILFALLVKLLLFPTAAMSKKGMMKMSRLTPKVKALEKKYADDKQKYQEEVNKLYKSEGAGGCGGCIWSLLPLLLLIPLYSIIREPITWLMYHGNISAAELTRLQNTILLEAQKPGAADALRALYDNGTLTGMYWQMSAMPHLTESAGGLLVVLKEAGFNNLVDIGTRFLGIELSTIPKPLFWQEFKNGVWNAIGQFLLPILSGGISWLSMWIGTKMNNTVIVDENGEQDKEMAKQSNPTGKIMNYMMPLFSVYIGFAFPAGLSLYWITQGVLGLIQDYFLTKHYKKIYDEEDRIKQERAAKEAALEAERERVRAEKRAQNPDGITENTSKRKLQQQQRQEKAEKEAAWQAKQEEKKAAEGAETPAADADPKRPFSRGRAFRADRYGSEGTAEAKPEAAEETETKNEE